MSDDETTLTHEFIASFQLDGVCRALEIFVTRGIDPGDVTRSIVKALRDDCMERWSGRAMQKIPEITDTLSTAELFVVAELLRATNNSFLTPEEREERGPFGFAPIADK